MLTERIKENRTAFSLSLASLILFGLSSLYFFKQTYPQAFESNKLELNNLVDQQSAYIIKDGSDNCLGSLNSKISSSEQNTEIEFDASLNINFDTQSSVMQIQNQNAFNPLQQLVASVTSISAIDYKFVVGILNVNPIEVSLNLSHNQKNLLKRKISIPGPIMLKQNKDQLGNSQLIIEYLPSGQSFPINLTEQISGLIKIYFVSQNSEQQNCDPSKIASLDLTKVKMDLENRYKSLIPKFGTEVLDAIKILESQDKTLN